MKRRKVKTSKSQNFALVAGLALAAVFSVSCSEKADDGVVEDRTQTEPTTKGLGEGYRDGFNDGHAAWSDLHANWTWLWMMSEDYRTEYDRGWADGREIRKLKDQQR